MIRNQTTEDMELDIESMVGQEATNLGNVALGNNPPPKDELGQDTLQQGIQVAGGWSSFIKGVTNKAGKVFQGHGDLTRTRTIDQIEGSRKKQRELPALDEESQESVSGLLDGQDLPPPGSLEGSPEAVPTTGLRAVDIDESAVQDRILAGEGDPAKRTNMRNLNIYRHMQGAKSDPIAGLEGIDPDQGAQQVAADVAAVIDAVAQEIGEAHVPRSLDTLDNMKIEDVRKELAPFLNTGKNTPHPGLMNDRQLYATRMVLATVGENVAILSKQIANGDATPEQLLNFQKAVKTHAALQQFLRGNVREVARALQQQTKIAKTLEGGSLNDIDELMNVAHLTPEQLKQYATVLARSTGKHGPIAGLRPDMFTRLNSWIGVSAEYWKASILSGPETHFVNMGGNLIYNAWENALVRPVAGAIGEVRTGIKNITSGKLDWGPNDDRVYLGEAMGGFASAYSGLRDSLKIAWRTLRHDDSIFNTQGKGETQGLMAQGAANIKTPIVGDVARFGAKMSGMPFRALQAEDDLFKTLAYRQEVTALSLRQAYSEGLTSADARKRAGELMEDIPLDVHEQALIYAKNLTYTNTNAPGILGAMGNSIKKLTAQFPLLQYVVPFVNTPVNLMARSIDMSVLSVTSPTLWRQVKAGGAEADVAVAKMTLGIGFTGAVLAYYTDGRITGNGPANHEQRKILEKTGWRPNSLRTADGTYVPYRRTDPFAASIAGLVDTLEAARYSGREEDKAILMWAGATGVAKHMMDGTFLRGVDSLFALLDGKKNATDYAAGIAAGFVPYSSLLRGVTKGFDPQPRRPSKDKEFQGDFVHVLEQKIKKMLPTWSRSMRPVRYWDGSVATPGVNAFTYAAMPVKTSQAKPIGAVDRALIENGVGIPEPDPMVSIGAGSTAIHFSIMDLDDGAGMVYDKYFERVGKARKERLTNLVGNREFQKLTGGPGGEQKLKMQGEIHKARLEGLHIFLKEDLMPMYVDAPDEFSAIAATLGMGMDALYERIQYLTELEELGIIDTQGQEELSHIRIGRGRQTTPLPVPPNHPQDFIGFD